MQREYIGTGSIQQLPSILNEQVSASVFLVTGKKSFEELDKQFNICSLLGNREVTHFNDFEVNPKIEDIERGIEAFAQTHADSIIAIGGGSAIDVAKAINFKSEAHRPLIAVPTTSGTGSESTHFAVVYVNGTKTSLADPSILPTIAIVDPELTYSLPRGVTRASGLDALTQAIESFWSNQSTKESKQFAKQAIQLILPNLEAAVLSPNPQNRQALSEGAHLAGKAINISFTTACHAISYPITSKYSVPHGEAVALTIPAMIVFNGEASQEVAQLLGCTMAQEAAIKITNLIKRIGGITKIEDFSTNKEEAIEYIVENGFNPERMKNNPKELTQEQLRGILTNL